MELPKGWKGQAKEFTSRKPGKDADGDVSRGEGVAMGRTHKGKAHEKVMTHAKEDKSAIAASHAMRERGISGNADPTGCCD